MPNPNDYETQDDFMSACVPERVAEGDERDQAVAACMSMWRDKGKSLNTWVAEDGTMYEPDEVKGLIKHEPLVEVGRPTGVTIKSMDDNRVVIGGYGILYSNTKDRDLENDYFAKDTDFWLDRMPGAKPVLYEHGQHDVIKKMSLGNTIEFKSDSVGLYVEAELDRHNQYIDTVLELVNKGVLGWSSGAVSHLVERSKDGLLKSWPIAEMTLTVAPAEPRLLGVSELRSLFEAGINIPFPEGPEEATDLDDMELVEEFEVDLLDYLPFLAG